MKRLGPFFLSIEFQNTGYLAYRYEKASFNQPPRYANFLRDTRRISEGVVVNQGDWAARLEQNKQTFTAEWVARPEFRALYDGKTNAEYVDALFANSIVTPTPAERDALGAVSTRGGCRAPRCFARCAE